MFERFTERARQVVVLAQDEARTLRHNYIGTEHILLGLLREEEGLAARVLYSLNVTVGGVRQQVARIVGQGDEASPVQFPFTPRARKVLELALREALSLGHNFIGTEHILLGLVRENEGVAARILLDFDVDAETARNEVIRMLMGPSRAKLVKDVADEVENRLADEVESRLDNRPPPFGVNLGTMMPESMEFYAQLIDSIAAAFVPPQQEQRDEDTKQVQPFPPAARHYRGLTAPDLQEIGEAALYSASVIGVAPEWRRLYADLADAASALLSKAHAA